MRAVWLMLLVVAGGSAGCAAPARRGDPEVSAGPVRDHYFAQPELRLRPVSVGGLRVPEGPVAAAAARISRYTGRPVLVEPATEVVLEPTETQVFAAIVRQLEAAGPVDARTIAVVPVAGGGVTGYLEWVGRGQVGGRVPVVVLKPETMASRANWFVREERLWEWTITHEMGHVLGVPADNSHAWVVPGLGGGHCTHPECVMYTGFDWRVLWTGLVRGWPMEFCRLCSGELSEARRRMAERGGGAASPKKEPP